MKRYSSGLYARLGFAVAIFSNPDIVLVDEVLAVGDAAFRRRALEALRRLIADGKTVLFISHDMWNVRRLCSEILWMEDGRVRAYGPAGEIAERYMNEVNLEALANQATRPAEPSRRHRRDPLHGGRPRRRGRPADDADRAGRDARGARRLSRRAAARATGLSGRDRRRRYRPRHHHRDVDASRRAAAKSKAPASSSAGLRGCRCGRASTCCGCRSPTRYQLASYDVVTRRPAIRGHRPRPRRRRPGRRSRTASCRCRSSSRITTPPPCGASRVTPRPGRLRLGPARRSGRQRAAHRADRPAARCARRLRDRRASRRSSRIAAFVREFEHAARAVRGSAAASAGRARRPADGAGAGELHRFGRHRVREDPPRRSGGQEDHPVDSREAAAGAAIAPSIVRQADALRPDRSDGLAPVGRRSCSIGYRPALLVASSPGLIFSEVPLLRTAVRRRVRSMAVDPSWDNFTNKLIAGAPRQPAVVWNDLMKQQAIELHGYAPDEIRIAGTPQWDLYFSDGTDRAARGVLPRRSAPIRRAS